MICKFVAAVARALGICVGDVINLPPNPGVIFGDFGPGNGHSIGQVFTAPQAILNDYSLTIGNANALITDTFPFVSQVYLWNGTGVVGSALFTSSTQTSTVALTTFTFSPDITLTPGDQYLALVTNDPNGVSLGNSSPNPGSTAFLEESIVSSGAVITFGNINNGPWLIQGNIGLAFNADFSPAAVCPIAWRRARPVVRVVHRADDRKP